MSDIAAAVPQTTVVRAIRSLERHKAVLAFLYPFIATCATVAGTWVGGGVFDTTQIRIAAGGLIASALGALGAWVGRPGSVEVATFPVETTPGLEHHPENVA